MACDDCARRRAAIAEWMNRKARRFGYKPITRRPPYTRVVAKVQTMQKYLDGQDVLVFWLADKPTWMDKLGAVQFSNEELVEIKRVTDDYFEMQKKLIERFGYDKFYAEEAMIKNG